MADATIEITGPEFSNITQRFLQEASCIVEQYAKLGETIVKDSMSGSKSGLIYRRGRIGRKMTKGLRGLRSYQTKGGAMMAIVGYKIHRASAPGEPPAIDLANLVNSVGSRSVDAYNSEVFASAEYAILLEFGTAHMAARPYMGPMADVIAEAYADAIQELLE